MTVKDVIIDALIDLQVIAVPAELDPDDAALALRYFRRQRDSFMANRLLLYTVDRQTFTTVPGQQTYTLGPTGNFATAGRQRPLFIGNVGVVPDPSVVDPVELPLTPYTRQGWLREPLKGLTALYPKRYRYEPTDTNGTLILWPKPTTAVPIILGSPVPLQALDADDNTALATVLIFPEGYEECWVINLSKRLERPFDKPADPQRADDAQKALSTIERLNDDGPPLSRSAPELCDGNTGGYDIWSNRYLGGR